MSPAWPVAARASRRLTFSGRRPRWVRSALRRQIVELASAALEASPGWALALSQEAADAAGAPARARAVADMAAAVARRRRWRWSRIRTVSGYALSLARPAALAWTDVRPGLSSPPGKGAGMAAAAILAAGPLDLEALLDR